MTHMTQIVRRLRHVRHAPTKRPPQRRRGDVLSEAQVREIYSEA
jgi:hypothetical protein